MSHVNALSAVAFATASALWPMAALPASLAWPDVGIPADAQGFDVGESLTLNGQTMHLQGFVSDQTPEQLERWYLGRPGMPLVRDRLGDKRVLGRFDGDYYITIQLEPAGGGTRALISTSNLKAASQNQEQTRRTTERWLNRLPPGSQLLSMTSSEDAGRLSRQLVIANGDGIALNRSRLLTILGQEGMGLEYETGDDGVAAHPDGRMLLFRGSGGDATAVIHRDDLGRTAVVLNLVTPLEHQR